MHAAELEEVDLPTLAVFRDGREVTRQIGAMVGPHLVQWIQAKAG
jgi:hypothetical protein